MVRLGSNTCCIAIRATYPSETFRLLRESEHRTRRLVLDAWDRQQQTLA